MDNINKNANVPYIEDFLYSQLSPSFNNVVLGFFPTVLREGEDDDILLIDIPSSYGYDVVLTKVNVYIWLCAKNESNSKNSALLKTMEDKYDEIIENFQDKNNTYLLRKGRAQPMVLDDVGYCCNVITTEVTIL